MKKKIFCLGLCVFFLMSVSLVVYALGHSNDGEYEQEQAYNPDAFNVSVNMFEFFCYDDFVSAMDDPMFTLNEGDFVIIAGRCACCDNDISEYRNITNMFTEVFDNPELGYIIIESSGRGTIYVDNYESLRNALENMEDGDLITVPVNEIVETVVFYCLEDLAEWMLKHNMQLDMDEDSFSARSCARPCHPIQFGAPWTVRIMVSRTWSQLGNSIVHRLPCTISVHSLICTSHQYRLDVHCGRSCGVFSSTTSTESGCREHRADVRGGPCIC